MLIDVHCHLDAQAYPDPDVVCQQSREAGVSQVVAVGMGEISNQRILNLHEQFPQQVWAALGLHPERLDTSWTEVEAVLEQIQHHRGDIVAVGEIGLPHYALLDQRMTEQQARERQAFLEVLVQAAARAGLPVVLHAPHAMAALALEVVKRYDPASAVFHWHKSTPETTAAIHEAGYYISVTPEVCYRERDQQLVQAVPLDRLLLESDGPWPYNGAFTGQRTTPALVAHVAEAVARIKGVPLAVVQAVTADNARQVFATAA
jgi:TatD DNase family protein